ncbi:MAG: hypothetical protein WA981_03570 [Glaciecola sp.]
MIGGLLKIIVVALTFPLAYVAELSYLSDYYYANSALVDCVVAILAVAFAIQSKSNSLLCYATVYIISAALYSLFYMPSAQSACYYLYYEADLNFSMIITFSDCLIMFIGGINVFYRLYTLRRDDSGSDDIFNARLGVHKWAK